MQQKDDIKRRLFAEPSQKMLGFNSRPYVTCDRPSDYGTGISLSSSSCPCYCISTIALSAINSHLSSNVWKYIPVEVWDTPIPAAARLLRLWVRILQKAWKFSVLMVVCCKVQVSVSSWSLVQRSPIDCGVSECDLETSRTRKTWPALGCKDTGRKEINCCTFVYCNFKQHNAS